MIEDYPNSVRENTTKTADRLPLAYKTETAGTLPPLARTQCGQLKNTAGRCRGANAIAAAGPQKRGGDIYAEEEKPEGDEPFGLPCPYAVKTDEKLPEARDGKQYGNSWHATVCSLHECNRKTPAEETRERGMKLSDFQTRTRQENKSRLTFG